MKKAIILLILMSLILVAGCTYENAITNDDTYKGESKNWTGEYKVNYLVTFPKEDGKVYADQKEDDTLIVSYKGDISDLSSVRHLNISYKHGSSGGSLTEDYDSPPQRKAFKLGGSSGLKVQIGEYPQDPEKMNRAIAIYGGNYKASVVEKIEVLINLDGQTESIELLPSKTFKPYSLDFELIKASLSKMRHPGFYLSHVNYSGLALELINSSIAITNDRNIVGAVGITEGDKKGQELVPTALYYEFTIKNLGNRKVGRIDSPSDLQIKIIPNEKLKEVSEETLGINIFEFDSYNNTGFGYGQSIEGDFLNTIKECNITLFYDLGVSEESPQATLITPSADKLEKLRNHASDASLIIIYKDTEIARFDLNEK